MRGIILSKMCGVSLVCLSCLAIIDWFVNSAFFLTAFTGYNNIVFNTALSFGLAGILFLFPNLSFNLQRKAYYFFGTLLSLIAILILSQTLFGLSFENDIYIINPTQITQDLHPERIINTSAISFLLVGIALLALPEAKKNIVNRLSQVGVFSAFILGLTAFLGQLLALMPWSHYFYISLYCTLGNAILGTGLWLRWKQRADEENLIEKGYKKIILPFSSVAIGVTLVVGLVLFAIFPSQNGLSFSEINQQIMPLVLMSIVIGMSLLLWQIMPLMQKIVRSDYMLVQSNTRLKESENRFRSAFDSAAIGMALISLRGQYLKVNQALCQILGYTEKELLNINMDSIIHQDDIEKNKQIFEDMASGKVAQYQTEQRYKNKHGEIVWISVNTSMVSNQFSEPLYFIAQMQNVTTEKNTEKQLRHLAYHDTLTGLFNRNKLEQQMGELLSSARRHDAGFAVIFLDMDHFKNINDTKGHDVGDSLLQIIAERLKNTVRETDIIARLGGDEFVVVITDINKVDQIASIVQKIFASLQQPIVIRKQEIYVTMSIGISVYPYDGHDIKTLMKNADLALYRAKEIGRNNYQFCTPEMTSKAQEKMARQNALIQALAKNEFILNYQPKLDLVQQRVNGVEALLRWNSKEYGIVSPTEIIQLAEETGLIISLNEWVLKTACAQVKKWHAEGIKPLSISINLSSRQFKQFDLADGMLQILKDIDFPTNSLEVEITEGLIMNDPEYVLKILQEFKKNGVCVAIDDFGTGYSSIDYLRRFAVDRIKIDKTFIQRITVDESSASAVTAIIAMAKKLNIATIAEGVETKAQYEFLLHEKCTEIQGYYLSPPLDAEMATHFLRHPITASYLMKIATDKSDRRE